MNVRTAFVLLAAGCCALNGCMVPKTQFDAVESQNQYLREQSRAQIAEIENLRDHTRRTEDQLNSAEQRLGVLDDQLQLNRQQLGNYESERQKLHDEVRGLANARLPLSPETNRRLEAIAQKYPNLRFDPKTGVAKLEVDILFDTGKAELKPGGDQVLGELVGLLRSPEGKDLRVFVVGHTDDRPVAKKPARDQYNDNLDLSTARAQAVAAQLRKLGLEDPRLGVAGFGSHEPVASNTNVAERKKNRRVEIFLIAPEVPVVGWTETIPGVY